MVPLKLVLQFFKIYAGAQLKPVFGVFLTRLKFIKFGHCILYFINLNLNQVMLKPSKRVYFQVISHRMIEHSITLTVLYPLPSLNWISLLVLSSLMIIIRWLQEIFNILPEYRNKINYGVGQPSYFRFLLYHLYSNSMS